METFGQKLRQAIASRGLTIEQVAQVTGLGMQKIRALEADDFSGLGDDGAIVESLRALARVLEVDADEVIADYRRERQRAAPAAPAPTGEDEETAAPSRPGRMASPVVPAAIILAVAAVTLVVWLRSPGSSTAPPATPSSSTVPAPAPTQAPAAEEMSAAEQTQEPNPEPSLPVEAAPEPATVPPPAMPAVKPSEIPPASPALLSIPKHGVGRNVVNHELVGRAERFSVGSRVWYWTLVEGGTPGMRIDHVWMREGVEVARVPLRIGSSHWRTKSYKSLKPGSEGNWAVEARDEDGHVLARREFRCTP